MIRVFRSTTPARRADRATCKHYHSYLDTLREDFLFRCGYCDDLDGLRIRSFTIDHFVPQKPDGFVHDIEANYYYNLVYSCRYCNAAKTNKWPTGDAKIHHNGNHGFIDPVEADYTALLQRDVRGVIGPVDPANPLALYIVQELKLWLPIHEKMWKLERIRVLNGNIQKKLDAMDAGDRKDELEKCHYRILKAWQQIQDSIYTENE